MGYSSQAGQLIARHQAVLGTLATDIGTAGVGIKLRSGSFGTKRELMIPDPEIGGGRDVVDALLGAVSWSGDFEFYARVDAIATLLQHALGVATPTVATGITTVVATPTDASLPFMSVEERIGSALETYNYTDVFVNTFHLECDANGYLIGKVGLIGAKQVAGATATSTVLWDETPMFVGTNVAVTLGGVALPAKSFSLDINNNIAEDDFRLGSFYLGDITAKRREVTASFKLRHASSSVWRQAVYGGSSLLAPGGTTVKSALSIVATGYDDIPAGTPSTKYSVGIAIPAYTFKPFSFEASGDDILENDVEGQALRPVAATPILTATIKTGKATIS